MYLCGTQIWIHCTFCLPFKWFSIIYCCIVTTQTIIKRCNIVQHTHSSFFFKYFCYCQSQPCSDMCLSDSGDLWKPWPVILYFSSSTGGECCSCTAPCWLLVWSKSTKDNATWCKNIYSVVQCIVKHSDHLYKLNLIQKWDFGCIESCLSPGNGEWNKEDFGNLFSLILCFQLLR